MRAVVAIPLAWATLLLCGCAARPPVVPERRIEMRELAADLQPVENDYRLLVREQTLGRFGCGLAIGKLAAGGQAGTMTLVQPAPAEEARWANAVCGLSPLRDLQFLSPVSLRPREPDAEALCAAADALGASLLLLYAPNRYGPNSAQVLGVLYETDTRRPIAALHASASFLDEQGVEVAPDKERGDRREVDAQYQASRAFEHHLLRCLDELIRSDSPAPTTEPHRWATPPAQRWWLPRD